MRNPVTIREIFFFAISLLLAFFLFVKGCNSPIDKDKYIPKALYDASMDSLHLSRNSLGQQEAKTKLLYASISDLMKLKSSKDSTIQKLLKLVNKKTIGATVLSNTTSNTVSSGTVSHGKDTIRKDSLIYVYPEYIMKPDSNRWEVISGKANKDSFSIHYRVFNEFEIVQRNEKQKVKGRLLKQNIPIIDVKNLNPKTETRELKSFTLQPPKQNKMRIFIAGGLFGILAEQTIKILLKK